MIIIIILIWLDFSTSVEMTYILNSYKQNLEFSQYLIQAKVTDTKLFI